MSKEKSRILVLDDDPVVTLSCKRILGAEGYDITTVDKGEDALNKLSKEEFDLLISDIRLPDINGLTVLKESRVIQPSTDVVIITGYPTLEDAKESIKLGAFEYIEKPFTPDFMMHVAKKIFDKRGWILRQAYIEEFREKKKRVGVSRVEGHYEGDAGMSVEKIVEFYDLPLPRLDILSSTRYWNGHEQDSASSNNRKRFLVLCWLKTYGIRANEARRLLEPPDGYMESGQWDRLDKEGFERSYDNARPLRSH